MKLRFSIRQPLLTWIKSLFLFFGINNTNLRSSPLIATSVLSPIGFSSKYVPDLTLIVSPSCATAAAAPIVYFASPSNNPLFVSHPFFVTHIVLFVCTPDGLQDTPTQTPDTSNDDNL